MDGLNNYIFSLVCLVWFMGMNGISAYCAYSFLLNFWGCFLCARSLAVLLWLLAFMFCLWSLLVGRWTWKGPSSQGRLLFIILVVCAALVHLLVVLVGFASGCKVGCIFFDNCPAP